MTYLDLGVLLFFLFCLGIGLSFELRWRYGIGNTPEPLSGKRRFWKKLIVAICAGLLFLLYLYLMSLIIDWRHQIEK